jgi:hypothetical protein
MSLKIQSAEEVRDWSQASEEEIPRGYEEMAADEGREAEALEWSEALTGDGLETPLGNK